MAIRKADGRAFIVGSGKNNVLGTIRKMEHDRQDMTITSVTVCHMVSEMTLSVRMDQITMPK